MSTIFDHFLFYSNAISGNELILDAEEKHHAGNVVRVKESDRIFVTDGKGCIYFCRVESIDRKKYLTTIIEQKAQEPPRPAMHFCVGLPEKEAFASTLLGLVPLGVLRITPVECRFSQKKWWHKNWEKQKQRFDKKIIAAAKQSWNAWFPELSAPVSFAAALSKAQGIILVADERGETLDLIEKQVDAEKTITACIGPPGGFSPEEIDLFKSKKAVGLKLANRRLRTELAATVLAGNLVQKFG